MKKQILTKQDVQRDLLKKLHKTRSAAIITTVIIIALVAFYSIHLIKYLSGEAMDYDGFLDFFGAIYLTPILIIIFTVTVLYVYYIDLYRIKKGRFYVIEDTVYTKKQEWLHTYRHYTKLNMVYFSCGRAEVDDATYKEAREGERYYLVFIQRKRRPFPRLIYHTKRYDIDQGVPRQA